MKTVIEENAFEYTWKMSAILSMKQWVSPTCLGPGSDSLMLLKSTYDLWLLLLRLEYLERTKVNNISVDALATWITSQ